MHSYHVSLCVFVCMWIMGGLSDLARLQRERDNARDNCTSLASQAQALTDVSSLSLMTARMQLHAAHAAALHEQVLRAQLALVAIPAAVAGRVGSVPSPALSAANSTTSEHVHATGINPGHMPASSSSVFTFTTGSRHRLSVCECVDACENFCTGASAENRVSCDPLSAPYRYDTTARW